MPPVGSITILVGFSVSCSNFLRWELLDQISHVSSNACKFVNFAKINHFHLNDSGLDVFVLIKWPFLSSTEELPVGPRICGRYISINSPCGTRTLLGFPFSNSRLRFTLSWNGVVADDGFLEWNYSWQWTAWIQTYLQPTHSVPAEFAASCWLY